MTKNDLDAKLQDISKRITSNKTKHLLVENEPEKLLMQVIIEVKIIFWAMIVHIVFQPMQKYFKKVDKTEKISSWKSKGLSIEIIKSLDNKHAPKLIDSGERLHVKFEGSYLKKCYSKNIPTNSSYPLIQNSLFNLIKDSSIDKVKFIGYGFGFDSKGTFSHQSGGIDQNGIIFEVDMNSSVHIAKNVRSRY